MCGAYWPGKGPSAPQGKAVSTSWGDKAADKGELEEASGEEADTDALLKATTDALTKILGSKGGFMVDDELTEHLAAATRLAYTKQAEAPPAPPDYTARFNESLKETAKADQTFAKKERNLEHKKNAVQDIQKKLDKAKEELRAAETQRDEALAYQEEQHKKHLMLVQERKDFEKRKEEEKAAAEEAFEEDDEDMLHGETPTATQPVAGAKPKRRRGAATAVASCGGPDRSVEELDEIIKNLQRQRQEAADKESTAESGGARGRNERSRSPRVVVTPSDVPQAMDGIRAAAKGAAEAVAAGGGKP